MWHTQARARTRRGDLFLAHMSKGRSKEGKLVCGTHEPGPEPEGKNCLWHTQARVGARRDDLFVALTRARDGARR